MIICAYIDVHIIIVVAESVKSVLTSLIAIVTNVIMNFSWEDVISLSLQLNRNDDIYYFCQYRVILYITTRVAKHSFRNTHTLRTFLRLPINSIILYKQLI